jgi:hypothetical protein
LEIKSGYLMNSGLFPKSVALAAVIAPICHGIPIPNTTQYRNVDYEFAVSIPSGLHACMNSPPCPNHGVWVPLDRSHCDDVAQNISPYVTVNADYNTAEIGDTAAALAAAECRWREAKNIIWLHGSSGCMAQASAGARPPDAAAASPTAISR